MRSKVLVPSLFAVVACLLFGVGLSGCTSATDSAVESAAEKATGGDVDVDTSENRVAININGSSWEAGDSVNLPANFPSDIYVADGTIKVAMATDQEQGFSVSLESSKNVSELKTLYEKELASDGWTITGGTTIGDAASVFATKGTRALTATMGPNTEKTVTVVTLTTFADK